VASEAAVAQLHPAGASPNIASGFPRAHGSFRDPSAPAIRISPGKTQEPRATAHVLELGIRALDRRGSDHWLLQDLGAIRVACPTRQWEQRHTIAWLWPSGTEASQTTVDATEMLSRRCDSMRE
jgi:hypothetical protein